MHAMFAELFMSRMRSRRPETGVVSARRVGPASSELLSAARGAPGRGAPQQDEGQRDHPLRGNNHVGRSHPRRLERTAGRRSVLPMSGRAHRIMPVIRTCRTCTLIARDEAFLRLN